MSARGLVIGGLGPTSRLVWPGAGGAEPQPFELRDVSTAETKKIRVMSSTLAGGSALDLGFAAGDPDPGYVLGVTGSGVIYGVITINGTTGAITSRSLGFAAALPDDTDTSFHAEIGTYGTYDGSFSVWNSRYGPIGATICRNFHVGVGETTYFGVTLG